MTLNTSEVHHAALSYSHDSSPNYGQAEYHAFINGAKWVLRMSQELKDESAERKEDIVLIKYLENLFE